MAAKQPKIMSSRLSNMKFMQRGSAPGPPSPSTPVYPPAKKQRLSSGVAAVSSPSIADEATTPETLIGEGGGPGETKWYLSFKHTQVPRLESPLRIVSAGFSTLDTTPNDRDDASDPEDDESSRSLVLGRKSFGNFNKKTEKQQNPKASSSSESDEDEDADDGNDDGPEGADEADDLTGINALISQGRREASERARAERKEKKRAENAETQRLAELRRKKEVNLNKVASISNGGKSGSGNSFLANMVCHSCQGKGHKSAECPRRHTLSSRPAKRKPH